MGEKIPFFLDSPGDCVTDRRWRSSFSFKTCRLVRGSHVVQIGGRRGGLAGQNFRAEARESPRKPRDRGSDGRANTWALAESSQGIERERERELRLRWHIYPSLRRYQHCGHRAY